MRSGYWFPLLTAKYVELMEKLTAAVSYFIKLLPAGNLLVGMNQGTLKLLVNLQPVTAVLFEGMSNHRDLGALRSCSWGRWKEGHEIIFQSFGAGVDQSEGIWAPCASNRLSSGCLGRCLLCCRL